MPESAMTSTRFQRLVAEYREDHKNPINHILHVYVGWPICAVGVLLLPLSAWYTLAGFALGYAFMWTGHFVFEKNIPTVFKHPTTPFVMAWAVSRNLAFGLVRLIFPSRSVGTSREQA